MILRTRNVTRPGNKGIDYENEVGNKGIDSENEECNTAREQRYRF